MWKFQSLLWQTRSVLLSPLWCFFPLRKNTSIWTCDSLVRPVHQKEFPFETAIFQSFWRMYMWLYCVGMQKQSLSLLSFYSPSPTTILFCFSILYLSMYVDVDWLFLPFMWQGFKSTRQSHWSLKLCWQAISASRNPAAGRFVPNQQMLGLQLAQLGRDASAAVS